MNKVKFSLHIFLPILLSSIFHIGFSKVQRDFDYDSIVLYLSISATISTILLLGKELQYYQVPNTDSLIRNDIFTLVTTSLSISLIFFIYYKYFNVNFNFRPSLILLIPFKTLLDYFIIILNVNDKANFVRLTFDILYGVIQVISLLIYFFFDYNVSALIFIFNVYYFVLLVYYYYKINFPWKEIVFKLNGGYFNFGKALISGFGSFVAKFQFIIMSFIAPKYIGLANIAFTLVNSISVPYNYLTKLQLPKVLNDKSKFSKEFRRVRNQSLLFSIPAILAILIFVVFNPLNLSYFNNPFFYSIGCLYFICVYIDIFVGLKSSIVQIFGKPSIMLPWLFMILLLSAVLGIILNNEFTGVVFYAMFFVLSNIFFSLIFKFCFRKSFL